MAVFELLIGLAVIVAIIWPIVVILQRMGFSGWWTLLAIVPFGSLVGLWILSRVRWPKLDAPSAALATTFE